MSEPKIETRTGWAYVKTPPAGWRYLHSEDRGDGYFNLWTNAPEGTDPREPYQVAWFELKPYNQIREVTEWRDV